MEFKGLLETLAVHADQLNTGLEGDLQDWHVPAEQREEFLSLARLAEEVRSALAPVRPDPAFKHRLASSLTEMAQRRHSQDVLVAPPPARRELIVGAAIGSAVALAGGIVYLVRSHIQTRSEQVGQVRT